MPTIFRTEMVDFFLQEMELLFMAFGWPLLLLFDFRFYVRFFSIRFPPSPIICFVFVTHCIGNVQINQFVALSLVFEPWSLFDLSWVNRFGLPIDIRRLIWTLKAAFVNCHGCRNTNRWLINPSASLTGRKMNYESFNTDVNQMNQRCNKWKSEEYPTDANLPSHSSKSPSLPQLICQNGRLKHLIYSSY